MRKIFLRILSALVLFIVVFFSFVYIRFHHVSQEKFTPPQFTIDQEVQAADVKLGQHIFNVRNGCVDCHGVDLSGAKVMDNPIMGSIYGANLTPFALKNWTNKEIADAIRYGVHKSGRSLRFMPSFDFKSLSKGDIAALIAYIRSVPPVSKPSHVNTYGPLARTLSMLGKMPVMFPARVIDMSKSFVTKPPVGATLEFGRYLAQSCTGCHGAHFEGGPIPGGDPSWPKAADIRLGDNPIWTEASFDNTIRTGISPLTHKQLRIPMPINELKEMNQTELKALWLFLSSLK